MRYFIVISLIILAGCSSIPRPDLGTKKVAGDTFVAKETTLLGKPMGRVTWEKKPTKLDTVTTTMQTPAKWTLKIVVPLGFLSGAMMVGFMTFLTPNPRLMKLSGTIAGLCLVVAVLASAWIIASTWLLITIPIVIVAIVILYSKTKGKSLKFTQLLQQ